MTGPFACTHNPCWCVEDDADFEPPKDAAAGARPPHAACPDRPCPAVHPWCEEVVAGIDGWDANGSPA